MHWPPHAKTSLRLDLGKQGITDIQGYYEARGKLKRDFRARVDRVLFRQAMLGEPQEDPSRLVLAAPPELLALPIEYVNLGRRVDEILSSHNVAAFGDLARVSREALSRHKGVGKKTLRQICEGIQEFVLSHLTSEGATDDAEFVAYDESAVPRVNWLAMAPHPSREEISGQLLAFGICDDDSFIESRPSLPAALRYSADFLRFLAASGAVGSPKISVVLRFAPDEILTLPIEAFPLSTRARNALRHSDVRSLQDLANKPADFVRHLPYFGKKTRLEIDDVIRREVRSRLRISAGAADEPGRSELACDSETASSGSAAGSSSGHIALSLREAVDESIRQMPPRRRMILQARLVTGGRRQTLEEVGSELGITRERVRQIEKKIVQGLQRSAWAQEMVDRVGRLLKDRETPLYAYALAAEDRWFEGLSGDLDLILGLIETASAGRYSALKLDGWDVLSPVDLETYRGAKESAEAALEEIATAGPTRDACRLVTESSFFARGAGSLSELGWAEVQRNCLFATLEGEEEERLIALGRSYEAAVQGLLRSSSRPLHYREATQLLLDAGLEGITERRVHNALASNVLLGRGTYGTWKHVGLSEDDVWNIVGVAGETMRSGRAGRQWHSRELLAKVVRRASDIPEHMDKYVLSAALSRSDRFKYLGRQVWILAEGASGQGGDGRLEVMKAVETVLHQAGRPLVTKALRKEVVRHRGMSQFFQIHPDGDIIRLEPGLWGLRSRDVLLSDAQIAAGLDTIHGFLGERQTGLRMDEVLDVIASTDLNSVQSLSWAFWLGMAQKDSRFRVGMGGVIGLSEWDSLRRETYRKLAPPRTQ